ncbi:hypothetical protein EV360DRAFT_90619 [Lentinula raphanica]|nr:hypothetical protein EV360DRAFT_90619 [Lentinula raphanica]
MVTSRFKWFSLQFRVSDGFFDSYLARYHAATLRLSTLGIFHIDSRHQGLEYPPIPYARYPRTISAPRTLQFCFPFHVQVPGPPFDTSLSLTLIANGQSWYLGGCVSVAPDILGPRFPPLFLLRDFPIVGALQLSSSFSRLVSRASLRHFIRRVSGEFHHRFHTSSDDSDFAPVNREIASSFGRLNGKIHRLITLSRALSETRVCARGQWSEDSDSACCSLFATTMSSPVDSTMPPAPTNTPLGSPPPYPADEDRSSQVVDDSGNALDLRSAVRSAVLGIVRDPRLMGSEFDPSRLPATVLDGILSNVLAFNAKLERVERYVH